MKKKILSIFLSIVMLFTAIPFTHVHVTALTYGDFEYAVLSEEDKTAEITKYNGSKTEVEIPSVINGYTVIAIGGREIGEDYLWSDSVTHVIIPSTITSIGVRAFSAQTSLTKITVSEDNLYYSNDENGVLYNKDKTQLVQYPAGKTETSYAIPNTVTTIGQYAFDECTNLTDITIPDSVTTIGQYAFSWCENLTSIAIPEGVTVIEEAVFTYCMKLASVTLPDGLTTIGDWAFSFCYELTSLTLPETVTTIGEYAFYNSWLSNIIIPDSVTSIGNNAFELCYNFTDVYYMGSEAKWGEIEIGTTNDPLTNATIHYNYGTGHSYGDWVVTTEPTCTTEGEKQRTCATCGDVETEIIPANIHASACYDIEVISETDKTARITDYKCTVADFEIPSIINGYAITEIGDRAFYCCTSLTNITIPDTVTTIGEQAFFSSTSLTNLIIPDSVTTIKGSAFEGCASLTSITIPNSVISIGGHAFEGCTSLTSITIPDSIIIIENGVFYNCTSLTSVIIPDSVVSIKGNAFEGCTSLTSITIPDSVTSVGWNAFSVCTSLEKVYYLGTQCQWNEISIGQANDPLTNATINYNSGEHSYGDWVVTTEPTCTTEGEQQRTCSACGEVETEALSALSHPDECACYDIEVISGTDKTARITKYKGTETALEIPSVINGYTITEIGYKAFANNTTLTSVTIPDTVTKIDSLAFQKCTGLTSVVIPDSVTTIGSSAFIYCSGLTSVTIGSGVETIGVRAFASCTALTSVTIPEGVTTIDDYAFAYCTSLANVTVLASVTTVGDYAFCYCNKLNSITVDENNANYSSENGVLFDKDKTILIQYPVGNTATSYEIPESVVTIGDSAFYRARNLTSVIIPDSVTTVENSAFELCSKLANVYYTNSESQWGEVAIGENNEQLTNATMNYWYGHTHSFDDWIVTTEPTCTTDGEQQRTCSACGEVEIETLLAKGSHSFDKWEVIQAPTCSSSGIQVRKCTACDEGIESREIEPLGHTASNDWVVEKEPTCADWGEKSSTCLICGEKVSIGIEPTDHNFGEKTYFVKPTCTQKGTGYHTCENCGYYEHFDEYGEHNYGEWQITVDPTTGAVGEQQRVCEDCGHIETQSVPALEYMLGDVNGDGNINMDDYNVIIQISTLTYKPTVTQMLAADINKDGAVDGYDAIFLQLFINSQA